MTSSTQLRRGADRRNVGPGFTRRRGLAALVMVALPVVLRWLEPWKLFSRTAIDETLPPGAHTAWLDSSPVASTEPAALFGS
jgi:hypothetical protein